jgi:hypothetical protein
MEDTVGSCRKILLVLVGRYRWITFSSKIEEIFFNLRSPKIDPRFSVGIVKFLWGLDS